MSTSPAEPIVGETLHFTGELEGAGARSVHLQLLQESAWTTVASGRTTATGEFELTTDAEAGRRTYRVDAPETPLTGDETSAPRQVTAEKTVEVRAQNAVLGFAPAPVGQSEEGERDLTPGTARFSPARPGREVTLQRQSDTSWVTVLTAAQDSEGSIGFNVPREDEAGSIEYRAVAEPHDGAPEVTSPATDIEVAPLLWGDEFDGTALDEETWEHRQLAYRSEESQRLCAEAALEAVSVADGALRFRVRPAPELKHPDDCPHGEYLNAHIGTASSFSFTHGVLAARIKFPHQEGQHGALWSQPISPADVVGDPALSGAEIDAVEYFGDDFRKGALQHSIYWIGAGGEPQKVGGAENRNYLLGPGKTWSNSFHVYSVEWTPTSYTFRVDGHITFRTDQGVSKIPQYVILSLLTSDWELDKMDPTKLNAMEVDWVRVWQP